MGGKESSIPKRTEILCPKCPLTPIISICLNSEGILTCEYRCPFMHFGQIPFTDIDKDKENKHGKFCDRCDKKEEEKNNIILEEDLLYCGTCRQFICSKCRPEHDKEKESHKVLVPKSKISYTCLEHGKGYVGFCFTCLISVCVDCKRHEKHCKKLFEEFYPEKDFIDNYKYYIGDKNNYLNSFKRSHGMNKEHFVNYKIRCETLIDLAKYLINNFEEKKKSRQLNGEILINLLNVVNFNYRADNYNTNEEFVKYCKTHLILSNKPISDICTFSKTKSDYNISKLTFELFHHLENNEIPTVFKYSPLGQHIVFSLGSCIHFLSTNKEEKENKQEKLGFKIRLDNKITSFNIINHNILCICGDKIYFYELIKNEPFYKEYQNLEALNQLNMLCKNVVEVFGNLDKNLLIRTKNELMLLNRNEKEKKFEITAKIYLDDINKNFEETKEVPDNTRHYDDYYYYGNRNRTKKITIFKKVITGIKGIWNDYVVTIENGVITTRNLAQLKEINTLKDYKNVDCLVFNGNVIIYNEKDIIFYSIPNLSRVSCLTVSDDIVSLNIVNKKTFIVVEKKYTEQFETNTWKRLWRQLSFGENVNNEKLSVIGAGKKLFFYDKESNNFYQAVLKQNEKKK